MDERRPLPLTSLLLCIMDFMLISLAFSYVDPATVSNGDTYADFPRIVFALLWIISGLIMGFYNIDRISFVRSASVILFRTVVLHVVLLALLLQALRIGWNSPGSIVFVYITAAALMIAWRFFYKLVRKYVEFTAFDVRRVVIVGTTRSGRALHEYFITNEQSGYVFRGFFDNYPNPMIVRRTLVAGTVDDLPEFCEREGIDEIYFALPIHQRELLERLAKFCDDRCIYFRIAPDFSEVVKTSHNVFLYNSVPVLTVRTEPLGNVFNRFVKRAFDIVFSLGVILILFPLIFPAIAIAIKLSSPGPVIFKQLRPGKRNKLFECYKFRTMVVNSASDKMAVRNDKRITRVGAFLRKTSLDEFPQFINVLLGDMSVVGPRPNLISQLEEYSRSIKEYRVRHFITPGITGYAQVNGCRGELKDKEAMAKRVHYDVEYMENWSLMLDLKIILKTVRQVVAGDDQAY